MVSSSTKKKTRVGQGAYFYPPVVIYESDPILQLGKPTSKFMRKIACDYRNDDGFRVLVTEDGFVCPFVKEKTVALEFLNVLFAVFITKFHRAQFITKQDLSVFIWEEGSKAVDINRVRIGYSLRNDLESRRDHEEYFELWKIHRRTPIHKHLMQNLLDIAYRFYKNDEFKNDLILVGESGGMYNDELYGTSLLSSWIIIENLLDKIWNDYIVTLKRTREERDTLKNHRSWTASHHIEALSFAGILKKSNYDCLTKLRKLRNDLLHGKKRKSSKEQAWNALSVAIYMMYNRLNQTDPFLDVEYKKFSKKE